MLLLTLHKDKNKIILNTSDGDIELEIATNARYEQIKIGITAPKEINIYRENISSLT